MTSLIIISLMDDVKPGTEWLVLSFIDTAVSITLTSCATLNLQYDYITCIVRFGSHCILENKSTSQKWDKQISLTTKITTIPT